MSVCAHCYACVQVAAPRFSGMSQGHLALWMLLETVPILLLALPAAQGVFAAFNAMLLAVRECNLYCC